MNRPTPDNNSPQSQITFKCASCRYTFKGEPSRVEDEPTRAHPYRYFGTCPECGLEVQQVNWEAGMFSSVYRSTGPKTVEGKAIASANLVGHPTPEEAKRTRFNALRHGAAAKTAMFFPARPGKYPQCDSCDVDHGFCMTQPACIKRTELMMQHLIAFESGDPSQLTALQAINQANLSALFQDMMQTVIRDGASLRNPVHGFDKDGGFHIGRYVDPESEETRIIEEVKAHPLLKPLFELLSKNDMSMADLNMTPKVQVDQGIQMGNLQAEESDREGMADYRKQMADNMAQLRDQIGNARQRIGQDPVLAEYKQDDIEDAEVISVQDQR